MSPKIPAKPAAIFLDRDGVINHEPGPILHLDQFVFIDNSPQSIRIINDHSIPCFIVTNQAAIARKQLSRSMLDQIHERMIEEFKKHGGSVQDIFCCFHYPRYEEGWDKELCHPCPCRKPGTGLFEQAAQKHGIDLKNSVMVGDSSTDYEAAQRLGMVSIGVETGHGGQDGKSDAMPSFMAKDLSHAVSKIFGS